MTTLAKLSARERAVFDLIVKGTPRKRIAQLLCVTESAISSRRKGIVEKLGVCTNAEFATLAAKEATARAADHALVAAALCARVARWEPFDVGNTGELCVNGLRYCTTLDAHGVPLLSEVIRGVLVFALPTKAMAA